MFYLCQILFMKLIINILMFRFMPLQFLMLGNANVIVHIC